MKSLLFLSLLFCAAASVAQNNSTSGKTDLPYFIDVHNIGPGKVQYTDVAAAHEKDLAAEWKHGVNFHMYFVNEDSGKIYCLSQARNANSIYETHKEAHGLVPDEIMTVSQGEYAGLPSGNEQLYLDIHHFSPGSITPEAIAEAHKKDMATESKYGVHFINYWVDEANGTVMCLSTAPNEDAIKNTHKEALGLSPDTIMKVKGGK
jgi:hypothetical protein